MDDAHERELESLLQFVYQIPVAVFRMNGAGLIDVMNPHAASLLAALGLPWQPHQGWDVAHALDGVLAERLRARLTTPGTVAQRLPVERRDAQGRLRHLSLTAIVLDPDVCMISIEDTTERVEQERQLAQQRQNLAAVLESIQGYFVVLLDLDLVVLQGNRSIKRMLGRGDEAVGQHLRDWLSVRDGQPDLADKTAHAVHHGWVSFEAEYVDATGATLWGDTILTTVVDDVGQPSRFVAVVRDISSRKQREDEWRQQARTDPLTGLLNRRGLSDGMAPWLHAAAGGTPGIAALALDIDHFKRVNDTHGHDGGDAVLSHVAQLLRRQFRQGDLVARLGGEEFVVILRDTTLDHAVALADRLRQHLEQTPAPWPPGPIAITVSIGVAVVARSDDADQLLRNADLALYRAKAEGRNRVVAA